MQHSPNNFAKHSQLQAAQVRKSSYVASDDGGGTATAGYDPNVHQFCTIYAGTYVQQVHRLLASGIHSFDMFCLNTGVYMHDIPESCTIYAVTFVQQLLCPGLASVWLSLPSWKNPKP